ncbi:BA14K family protein [Agrobacterium larrymoorei]|uniref:BA14K family protein n=1 Tax=Agrobacterium larrymoorei TaxID=160699 RepID=UPI001571DB24|nr:BA14K family protein [Agrobacterium larrymoorei]NTJ41522.1 BA14K family protein [Agrobacterium larrymoorei]
MKTYMKTILAAGLSAIIGVGAILPAQAMPVTVAPAVPQADNGVVNVQYWRDRGYYGRDYGGGWYRGHRGYRDYRPGYRRHNNGYWFPLAAFATGAIVGGALSQPREVYRPRPVYREYRPVVRGGVSQSHVNWCYGRYRSYDAYSNTFQPYNGPRRTCYSPYG